MKKSKRTRLIRHVLMKKLRGSGWKTDLLKKGLKRVSNWARSSSTVDKYWRPMARSAYSDFGDYYNLKGGRR